MKEDSTSKTIGNLTQNDIHSPNYIQLQCTLSIYKHEDMLFMEWGRKNGSIGLGGKGEDKEEEEEEEEEDEEEYKHDWGGRRSNSELMLSNSTVSPLKMPLHSRFRHQVYSHNCTVRRLLPVITNPLESSWAISWHASFHWLWNTHLRVKGTVMDLEKISCAEWE